MEEEKKNPIIVKSATIYGRESGGCLHDNCSVCNGTGLRKDGLGACIHMISCPCPKCSPGTMR